MQKSILTLALLSALAACGGDGTNPFQTTEDNIDNSDLSVESLVKLEGTENPSSTSDIYRYGSALDGVDDQQDSQNGYVSSVTVNGNEIEVCCLAFDGNPASDGTSVYTRDDVVASLNGYDVYEAEISTPDFLTSDAIAQIAPTRAIVGVSSNTVGGQPQTRFAIVRTGGYVGHGFGGFVYEREGGVVLPTNGGEARFEGNYAGMRTYIGGGGLNYTQADLAIVIDFGGFGNNTQTVRSEFGNYQVFDLNGNLVQTGFIDTDSYDLWIPITTTDALDDNGEMQASINGSVTYLNDVGELQAISGSGMIYGVLAGDLTDGSGGELVGVLAIDWGSVYGDDLTQPGTRTIGVSETGGFILSRSWP